MESPVFPYAVKNHDCIVDRKTDDSEQSGYHRQTNLPLKEGEEAECHQYIMKDCYHGSRTVGPLKPEGYIHEDAYQCRQSNRNRLIAKLSSSYRPNSIRSYDLVSIPFSAK